MKWQRLIMCSSSGTQEWQRQRLCVWGRGGGGMMNEERQEGEGRGETREITLGSAILNFDLV